MAKNEEGEIEIMEKTWKRYVCDSVNLFKITVING